MIHTTSRILNNSHNPNSLLGSGDLNDAVLKAPVENQNVFRIISGNGDLKVWILKTLGLLISLQQISVLLDDFNIKP
jgi:hypothetical protein